MTPSKPPQNPSICEQLSAILCWEVFLWGKVWRKIHLKGLRFEQNSGAGFRSGYAAFRIRERHKGGSCPIEEWKSVVRRGLLHLWLDQPQGLQQRVSVSFLSSTAGDRRLISWMSVRNSCGRMGACDSGLLIAVSLQKALPPVIFLHQRQIKRDAASSCSLIAESPPRL